jgi:hypothetical protein
MAFQHLGTLSFDETVQPSSEKLNTISIHSSEIQQTTEEVQASVVKAIADMYRYIFNGTTYGLFMIDKEDPSKILTPHDVFPKKEPTLATMDQAIPNTPHLSNYTTFHDPETVETIFYQRFVSNPEGAQLNIVTQNNNIVSAYCLYNAPLDDIIKEFTDPYLYSTHKAKPETLSQATTELTKSLQADYQTINSTIYEGKLPDFQTAKKGHFGSANFFSTLPAFHRQGLGLRTIARSFQMPDITKRLYLIEVVEGSIAHHFLTKPQTIDGFDQPVSLTHPVSYRTGTSHPLLAVPMLRSKRIIQARSK